MTDNKISYKNWQKVWNNRNANFSDTDDLLQQLILANGFDTGVGDYSIQDWKILTSFIAKEFGLSINSNVFEIGCGSGAFLQSLQDHSSCKIYGIDYSQNLIKLAKKYLKGSFELKEAIEDWSLNIDMDVIISHSVFNYFPDNDYVLKTLNNSFRNLRKGGLLIIMDLNNIEMEQEYHSERKKLYKSPEEYDEKYQNHQHLFFSKNELLSLLKKVGFKEVKFFKNPCKNYKNSKFRFNLSAKKIN
tara:strand:- start:1001 stop:1735 length:735 start_codon:yes stop_codon:yes gene_type:complete